MRTARASLTFVVLLVVAATGCGGGGAGPDSKSVGGRCAVDNDCDKRCLTGGGFPDGYCTRTCIGDDDCPSGAACVGREGGICLATCKVPGDCDAFGPAYQCNRESRQSGGEGALVCIGG